MDIVQHPVNDGLEELILIGMIISKEFISEIEHVVDPGYFQSPHIKQVSKWVLEYWDEFKEVPGTAIQEIYIAECRLNKIRPADQDLIQELLSRVFDRYEGREFNYQYMTQKALDYIRERSLRLTVEEALWLLDRKGSKEAEDRITEHKKVMKKTSANRNNSWLRDFSKTFNAWFYQDRTPIMSFPGNLGRYMHPLLRGKLIAFLAPPKSGKCLKEGTLIPLPNGDIIPIEQIVKRKIKSILTVNEDFSINPGKVTEWHTNGIKPVFKVSTNLGREVEITAEHPLLTPNGWKPLSQLKEGDFVAVPKRIPINKQTKTFDERQLKFLAYMIADGCIPVKRFSKSPKSKEVRKDFERCLEFFGDKVHWNGTEGQIVSHKSNHIQSYLWLKDLGLANCLSGTKFIPSEVLKSSSSDIQIFLNTLFTCDGCSHPGLQRPAISYCSKSKTLFLQVNTLLQRFGIVFKTKEKFVNGVSYYELVITSEKHVRIFLDQIGFSFHKKREPLPYKTNRDYLDIIPCDLVFDTIKESETQKKFAGNHTLGVHFTRHNVKKVNQSLKSPKIQELLDADISWAKIICIEPSGEFPTYDITVDKTHNFITTDFVIHNSWHLIHCAFTALTQRKNVIFFSLEMSEEEVQERFTTMALAKERTIDSKPVEYTIPVYDCLLNQNGECRRSLCPTPGESILVKDKKPKYTDAPEHVPCTACRELEDSDYIPETWMKTESRDPLKHNETFRQIRALKKHFHLNGLRIFTFRIGRASIEDIESVLDDLESSEAWLPDVVCLDYADLLDHNSTYKERRHQLGHIWENLSGIAKARQVLLFTASQGNRGSASKSKLESSDIAEDWSKVAIVDGLIGINSDNSGCTVVERDSYWHRHSLQWLAHRYKKHLKLWESCQVLHQFDIGQPVIDSEII